MALLREHDVVGQFERKPLVELDALVVKSDALGSAIIGPDDRRIAAAGPAAKIAFVEQGNIGDTMVLAEVISDGQPMNAGADDYHVIGRLQLVTAPHPLDRHHSPPAFSRRSRSGASHPR